jgi:hypothetical protein
LDKPQFPTLVFFLVSKYISANTDLFEDPTIELAEKLAKQADDDLPQQLVRFPPFPYSPQNLMVGVKY